MNENKAIRTDLASEAVEGWEDTEGVRCESREAGRGVRVTRVRILSESAAKRFGRPQGNYATIDAPGLSENDPALNERVICTFAEELGEFVKGLKEEETVLVAGLGNRAITADALRPQTAEKVLVSRKITEFLPDAMEGKVRPVCAVAPGVLGVTGIETGEILKGVAERVRPQLILVVDALASRSTERIANSIQITDTGICPGSGLGNNRAGLSEQTMGLPVVAIDHFAGRRRSAARRNGGKGQSRYFAFPGGKGGERKDRAADRYPQGYRCYERAAFRHFGPRHRSVPAWAFAPQAPAAPRLAAF